MIEILYKNIGYELVRVIQEQMTGKAQGEAAGSGIVVKKYGYDGLSRVTSFEIYNNSTLEQGVEYGYNEVGQLTSLREGGANYGYEYPDYMTSIPVTVQ